MSDSLQVFIKLVDASFEAKDFNRSFNRGFKDVSREVSTKVPTEVSKTKDFPLGSVCCLG